MKKILFLLGALIIGANSFSVASVIGGWSNMSAGGSLLLVSNWNLSPGVTTVTATGTSTISAGNVFNVPTGGTLNIVTDSGTIQTITGPATVTLTQPLTGSVSGANLNSYVSVSGGTTPTTPTPTPTTPVIPSTPTRPTTSGTVPTITVPRSRVDYD